MKTIQFYFLLSVFALLPCMLQAQTTSCFQFALSAQEASKGDTVRLALSARGFQKIRSFSFTLSWDTLLLRFHKLDRVPSIYALHNPLLTKEGRFLTLWDDPSAEGVTMPDDSTLMHLWFIVEADQSGFLPVRMESETFINLIYEVVDSSSTLMPYAYQIGGVYANGAQAPDRLLLDLCLVQPLCQTNGAASALAPGQATHQWFDDQGFISVGDSVHDLSSGLYTLKSFDTDGREAEIRFKLEPKNKNIAVELDSLRQPYCHLPLGYIAVRVDTALGPVTYNWSDIGVGPGSRSGLRSGEYVVTVTNTQGCTGTRLMGLYGIPAFSMKLDSTNADCRTGEKGAAGLEITGGYPPFTHYWYLGEQFISSDAQVENLKPGIFRVVARDSLGCTVSDTTQVLDYGVFDWLVYAKGYCGTELNDHQLVISNAHLKNRVEYPLTLTLDNGIQEYFENTIGDTLGHFTQMPIGTYQFTVTDAQGCSLTRQVALACDDLALTKNVTSFFGPRVSVSEYSYSESWQADSSCASIKLLDGQNIDKMDFSLAWNPAYMELAYLKPEPIFSNYGLQVSYDPVLKQVDFSFDNTSSYFSGSTNMAKVCFKKKGSGNITDLYFVKGKKTPHITLLSGQNVGFAGMGGRIHFSSASSRYNNEHFGSIPPDCLANGYGQIYILDDYLNNKWTTITEIIRDGVKISPNKGDLVEALPGTYQIKFNDQGTHRTVYVEMPHYGSYNCVWPGDLDGSGAVNQYDFAFLQNRSKVDPRPFANQLWYGQDGHDRDANGDGLCNAGDSMAVMLNWGRVTNPYKIGPGAQPDHIEFYRTLSWDIGADTFEQDGKVYFPVYVKPNDSLSFPIQFWGAGFCVNYDTDLFPDGIGFATALPGESNTPIRCITMLQEVHHKLDVGLWLEQSYLPLGNDQPLLLGYLVLRTEGLASDSAAYTRIQLVAGLLYANYVYYRINDSMDLLPVTSSAGNVVSANDPANARDAMRLYPNPAADFLEVQYDAVPHLIELIDGTGRVIRKSESPHSGGHRFDVAGLAAGVYYLRAVTHSGVLTKAFMKN